MNVQELVPTTTGTIEHYVVTTVGFTLVTVWIITAFQCRYIFRPGVSFWLRLGWPVFLLLRFFGKDPYAPTSPNMSEADRMLEMMKLDQELLPEPRK